MDYLDYKSMLFINKKKLNIRMHRTTIGRYSTHVNFCLCDSGLDQKEESCLVRSNPF
jgi:hypothetical protein